MPKSPTNLAQELKDELRREGVSLKTMSWPQFYERADAERLFEKRLEDYREACLANGTSLGYGNNVVVVFLDSNFGPDGVG